MRGNLREKRAELIEQVNTYYVRILMNRKIRNTLIISTLFSISVPVMALKDDTQQLLLLIPRNSHLILGKNITTFHTKCCGKTRLY